MVARKAPPCGQLWGNVVPRVSLLCLHCLFSTTMEAEKRDPGNEVDCGVGIKRVQGSHFHKRKAEPEGQSGFINTNIPINYKYAFIRLAVTKFASVVLSEFALY